MSTISAFVEWRNCTTVNDFGFCKVASVQLSTISAMYVLGWPSVCVCRVGILVPKPGTARGPHFLTPPRRGELLAGVCDQCAESQRGSAVTSRLHATAAVVSCACVPCSDQFRSGARRRLRAQNHDHVMCSLWVYMFVMVCMHACMCVRRLDCSILD